MMLQVQLFVFEFNLFTNNISENNNHASVIDFKLVQSNFV